MAEVTAEMVKNLRERTGARLLDCQKALKETGGSMDDAVAWLRKQNLAAGAKVGEKTAEEGMVGVKTNDGALAAVELTANTDFVTKNDEFRKLLESLSDLALTSKSADAAALSAQSLGGRPVGEVVKELAGKIGENITIKRVVRIEGAFGYYLHSDYKQFAAVQLSGVTGEKAQAIGKDLAMHVVFAKPTALKREEVPQDLVNKEMEIAQERLKNDPKNSKKPPEILAKIAQGQLDKFYGTIVLVDQPYYRENAKTVTQHLKEQGGEIKIERFEYIKVGA
ncbi:MAG: translation elongation factor Ts [Planctomycetota bacterium]|nr:translation elongation factor Ts [Planctomycetota bacterium]